MEHVPGAGRCVLQTHRPSEMTLAVSNGAEQTISLANRVTSLSDKFAVQQPKAIKRSEALFAHGWFPEEFMLFCSALVYSMLCKLTAVMTSELLSGLLSSNTALSALFIAPVLLFGR